MLHVCERRSAAEGLVVSSDRLFAYRLVRAVALVQGARCDWRSQEPPFVAVTPPLRRPGRLKSRQDKELGFSAHFREGGVQGNGKWVNWGVEKMGLGANDSATLILVFRCSSFSSGVKSE
jgi:hypothetical protein